MRRLRAALVPALFAVLACSGLGEPPVEPDAIALAEQPAGEAHRDQPHSVLSLPDGADPGTPITTVIWLHGLGGDPWLADAPGVRRLVESRHAAVLGVSGTLPMDGGGYTWAEDPARDLARIDAALAERAEAFTPAPGRTVLLGFSQGATQAVALAMAHPDRFAGAISISPGRLRDDPVPAARSPLHESQGYVVRVGDGEHAANILYAEMQAREARALKADVDEQAFEGHREHSLPETWTRDLPGWVESVVQDRGGLPEVRPVAEVLREQAGPAAARYARRGSMPEIGITIDVGEWVAAEGHAEMAIVAEVVNAALAEQRAAEATWTDTTDNDRLDRAFAALDATGILARPDFSDCGSCGAGEMVELIKVAEAEGRTIRGYAFFHGQDTDALLDGSRGLYLSYGANLPDDAPGAAYQAAATRIGQEVADALRAEGLTVDWDGDLGQRIGVEVEWRRRRFTEAPPR